MSELSRCNRCALEAIRRSAKAQGERVVLRRENGGVSAYRVPRGVKNAQIADGMLAAWLWQLPRKCCCDED